MADAAARAAYKNGELDVVESRTLSAYNEMKDVANSEIRRGRRLRRRHEPERRAHH